MIQAACVARGRATPWRAKIASWRYNGSASTYLLVTRWASIPGAAFVLGRICARQGRGLQALLAARAGVLLAHVLQHLDLRRHVIELLGDLAADLDERAAAGALPLALGELVEDRHARQMGGDGFAASFGARAVCPRAAGWL